MANRQYAAKDFVAALAKKTGTPILVITTEGSCASSLRYNDIHGISEETIDTLIDEGVAFMTFDTVEEGTTFFREIHENFPAGANTTLSISAVLGIPSGHTAGFEQVHGGCRSVWAN